MAALDALKRFDVEIVSVSGSPPNQKALIRRPEEPVGGAPGRPLYPVLGYVTAGQRAWCFMDKDGAVVVPPSAAWDGITGKPSSFTPSNHNLFSSSHPDVEATDTPANGEVLTYDSATGKWKASPPAAGGNHNLFSSSHPDVDAADVPADNEVLKYDSAAAKWKAAAHIGVGGSEHPDAVAGGASGFLSGTGKSKLDRALDIETSQRVVYVSTTGSDTTGDGTSTNRWRTIQYAVDQARSIMQRVNGVSSYKIVCASGTYDERVTIPANLLSSFNAGGQGGIWITSESQLAADVVITSTNAESTLNVFGSCTLDRVTIENDTFGILVRGNVDTHCFVVGCVIRRRSVADGGNSAIYAQMTRVFSENNSTTTGRRFLRGLRAELGAVISRNGSQPSGTTNNELVAAGGQILPTRTLITLDADVVNNNAVANTFQDVTGLSFGVSAGVLYKFVAMIAFDAAATTTGSRWSVNGPAFTRLFYIAEWTLTASSTFRSIQSTYNAGTVQATSILSGNLCRIEGIIQPSAAGTVVIRFASEVANSAITAKAGSTLEWW